MHSVFSKVFDDTAQAGICGCGACLRICDKKQYKIHWHGGGGTGTGTNMSVEISALWGLLWFSKKFNLNTIPAYGDSKSLIDNMLVKITASPPLLDGCLNHIQTLKSSFDCINFHHVYRESNSVADTSSKKGLIEAAGYMHFQYLKDTKLFNAHHIC